MDDGLDQISEIGLVVGRMLAENGTIYISLDSFDFGSNLSFYLV
jgi:hypothetical protein